jgi:predicted permease
MLDVRMDARLLGFAALLTLIATALGGVVPAWRASRTDVASALKSQSSAVTAGGRGLQLRDALVVGEIALSGVIMIAAALLVRSFAQTLAVNPGFDTRKNVATFYMVPGLKGYDDAATYRLFEECRQAVAALPGVKRVSYGIRLPGQGNEAGWSASFTIPGAKPPPGKTAFDLRYTMVGPEYFEVMGTRILGGRGINESDRPNGAPVAVVSESMARRFWPGGNPIGRRIRMGAAPPVDREVVGIAEDIRIGGLYEPPESYVYVPYAQDAQGFGLLLVETHDRPVSAVSAVRRRVGQIASALPILSVSSIEEHMNLLLYEDRRNAWVALAIAILALTLGAVGVHGVVALITARRTKEIGIRLVLGARRGQLLRQLLDKGLRLALVGVVLGIVGGIAAGRLLESRLHGLDPVDPWSIALGAIVCLTVAVAASFMPVWRATRLDPAVALRDE